MTIKLSFQFNNQEVTLCTKDGATTRILHEINIFGEKSLSGFKSLSNQNGVYHLEFCKTTITA